MAKRKRSKRKGSTVTVKSHMRDGKRVKGYRRKR